MNYHSIRSPARRVDEPLPGHRQGVSSGILLPNLEQVVVTNFLPAAVNTGPAAPARRLASPLSPSPLSCAVPSCRRFSGGCDPTIVRSCN